MQMFVLVLNREEFLEPLLEEMLKQNIGGATILESTGMMRVLDGDHNIDDLPVLGVLRHLCNPETLQDDFHAAEIRTDSADD